MVGDSDSNLDWFKHLVRAERLALRNARSAGCIAVGASHHDNLPAAPNRIHPGFIGFLKYLPILASSLSHHWDFPMSAAAGGTAESRRVRRELIFPGG
jgi:hypothetical protein